MSLVTEHLHHRDKTFEVLLHSPTMSAVDEARAVGVGTAQVIKTLVLDTRKGHALAVLCANERLDMRLVQRATGDPHAHLASEDELSRDFPDFELGAVPPLASLLGVPTYVDPDVMEQDTVVFPGGSHTESLRMRTAALFQDQTITITPLHRDPDYNDF